MLKYLSFFLLISFTSLSGQINRIDHLFIKSSKSEELFHFFKDELQLPVAWNYQNWGSFVSGGISFGNANLEFYYSEDFTDSKFVGIALEPQNSAIKTCKNFEALGIKNNGVQHYYAPNKSRRPKNILWTTMEILELLPQNIHLFVCEYKHKNQNRLLQNHKLGITRLKEIVVGSINPNETVAQIKKLPGIVQKEKWIFGFIKGANIQIIESENTGITAIQLQVESLEKTKQKLFSKGLLNDNGDEMRIILNPKLVDNLIIEFIEK